MCFTLAQENLEILLKFCLATSQNISQSKSGVDKTWIPYWYILFHDFDEIVLPHKHNNSNEMMADLERTHKQTTIGILKITCYTVEPLKTDTPRNRPKCPSQRGVRLIEVLKSIDIREKEFQLELIVVGQALINIKMNQQSKVKILQSVADYEIIILLPVKTFYT